MEKDKKDDLNWQKPEESDNLQKSVNPNVEYMEDRKLCPNCHGAVHAGPCVKSE